MGGVPAVDVQGRVFFREAQLLGLGQGVCVIGPVFPHGGKNIVGRSVNNAHNGIDVVANQGILQALDNGDAAAGGRFEINGGAHFRGKLENLRSVLGQKSFVPRNDGLAGPEGQRHQVVSLARPSNQLNNDVYFRVIDQILPIIRQQFPGNDGFSGLFQVAHGDALEPERNLAPGFQKGVIAAQRFINAGTDRSQPGKPKLYRFFRHSCRGIMQKNPCNARAFTVPECRVCDAHGIPFFPAFPSTPACSMRGRTIAGFSRICGMMGKWRSSLLRERMNPEKRQQKTLLEGGLDWQPHQDSNLEILNQNQVCYQLHYGAVCSGVSAVAGRSKPHGAKSGKRKNPNGGNMPLRRCPEQADADSIFLPWLSILP